MKPLPVLLSLLLLAAPVVAAVGPMDGHAGDVAGDVAGTSSADAAAAGPADATTNGVTATGGVDAVQGTANGTSVQNETAPGYNVLSLPADADTSWSITGHSANLGPASELEVMRTTGRMQTEEIRAHIESASTLEERQRRIVAAESSIRQAEVSLHQRQRRAIKAHAAGKISNAELLIELGRIALRAEILAERLDVVKNLADETEGFNLDTENLQLRLAVYQGPIRSLAVDIVRGEADPNRVFVESTTNGLVLATIIGDTYVREVYRGDKWDRGASGFEDVSDARNVTTSAYPKISDSDTSTLGSGTPVRVTLNHDPGQLRTFVSAGDGGVFVEHQTRDLKKFTEGETLNTTQDGLNLTIERTYAGGPVRVTVVDTETGKPIQGATVTVAADQGESTEVGTTNEEGQLWILSPGDSYRVTVIDDPRVARLTGIEPMAPPRVEE
ncbi:MAG: carboxypeptidase-like regulatory domain-containing protein [Halopenitus sp.]